MAPARAIAGAVIASAIAGCGGRTFGRVVTEVTVSPLDPAVLVVKSCDLVDTKHDVERVSLANCRGVGVPRSPILPVPVVDPAVRPLEDRFVTGFALREGGGATVTTCRLATDREGQFVLADCAQVDLPTAPVTAP